MKPRLVVAVLLASLAAGCSSTNLRLNRDWEDSADAAVEWNAQSPEGFVDRLGEPAVWRNEGKGDDLRMIALWKCLDGHDREVTWRQQAGGDGIVRWFVVSDVLRDADCP